jgi:hypothetical protein
VVTKRWVEVVRFLEIGLVLTALPVTGCGVFEVPDEAIAAVDEWERLKGENDPCRVNAMEHCVAASAVAEQCGDSCALILGLLLEIRQGDADPMDFHNNRAGAGCAKPIETGGGGAIACCEELLDAQPSALRTDGKCANRSKRSRR